MDLSVDDAFLVIGKENTIPTLVLQIPLKAKLKPNAKLNNRKINNALQISLLNQLKSHFSNKIASLPLKNYLYFHTISSKKLRFMNSPFRL